MSSPPPNPSLPLSLLPAPGSFVAPAPAVLTSEKVSGVLRDLTQAVQEIRLFLAGSYGPHPAAPPIAATAPPWLPWQPPHQAASAALAGPLQLPSTATTTPPWLQWQPLLLAASAAPDAPPQQPLQLQQPPLVSSSPASPAPAGVPTHQFDGYIDLDSYDTIAMKLRGDGRTYISTIYTENWVNSPGQEEDNSWQAFVYVPHGSWRILKIPLDSYLPTWKGNVIEANMEMNPSRVVGMSLSLNAEGGVPGAKTGPGDFRLDVDWIKAMRAL